MSTIEELITRKSKEGTINVLTFIESEDINNKISNDVYEWILKNRQSMFIELDLPIERKRQILRELNYSSDNIL